MPERLTAGRTIPTTEVQGEGSWIRVARVTVGEVLSQFRERTVRKSPLYWLGRVLGAIRRFLRRLTGGDPEVDQARAYYLLLASKIAEWNWVDLDGNPFPQPRDDPNVIFQLTEDEVQEVIRAVYGGAVSEEQKN